VSPTSRPPLGEELAVAGAQGAEGEQLEAVRTALEGPGHGGGDADGVQRSDLRDVVVELDPAPARQDDVDLLGVLVAVAEGLAGACPDAVMAEARLLGPELLVEPCLAAASSASVSLRMVCGVRADAVGTAVAGPLPPRRSSSIISEDATSAITSITASLPRMRSMQASRSTWLRHSSVTQTTSGSSA
jgi:hypothetical protein